MGFTTGFTGGVTLVLGVAYLSIRSHQKTRDAQSVPLRASTVVLNGAVFPAPPPPPPPSRAERSALQRANLVESAKSRWNQEVEGAVRWMHHTDWDEVRENAEEGVARLWSRVFDAAGEGAKKAQEVEGRAEERAGESVRRAEGEVKGAEGKVEAKAGWLWAGAADKGQQAKQSGEDAVKKVEEKAEEAKSSLWASLTRGVDKVKEAGDKAKDLAGQAEGRLEGAVKQKKEAETPVQRALRQRFEKASSTELSVDEALKARYAPVDQQNHSDLRGI